MNKNKKLERELERVKQEEIEELTIKVKAFNYLSLLMGYKAAGRAVDLDPYKVRATQELRQAGWSDEAITKALDVTFIIPDDDEDG